MAIDILHLIARNIQPRGIVDGGCGIGVDGNGAVDIHKRGFLAQLAQVGCGHQTPVAIGHVGKHLLVFVVERDMQRGTHARIEIHLSRERTRIGFGELFLRIHGIRVCHLK